MVKLSKVWLYDRLRVPNRRSSVSDSMKGTSVLKYVVNITRVISDKYGGKTMQQVWDLLEKKPSHARNLKHISGWRKKQKQPWHSKNTFLFMFGSWNGTNLSKEGVLCARNWSDVLTTWRACWSASVGAAFPNCCAWVSAWWTQPAFLSPGRCALSRHSS